jgi:hypothetical protein
MREDLQSIGWFDPQATRKRMPLYLAGTVALVTGLLYAVPVAVIEEYWVLLSGGMLVLVGAILIGAGTAYPSTTPEGERQAIPWRGYRDRLREAAKQGYGSIDLDDAFPYIVAFGLPNEFKDHFEQASERGYVPAWAKVADERSHMVANNWFIYWVAFHNSMDSHSTGSGGSIAGGAATGSGGAGGRF